MRRTCLYVITDESRQSRLLAGPNTAEARQMIRRARKIGWAASWEELEEQGFRALSAPRG